MQLNADNARGAREERLEHRGGYLSDGAQPVVPPSPLIAVVIGVARKRKWTIIGTVIGALMLGLIVTLLMTPQYTASVTLEIRRESQNFTNVEGADTVDKTFVDPEFYETQYGLLKSRSLADQVVVALHLFDDGKFFTMFGSRKARNWFEEGHLKAGASTREMRIREAGDLLLDHLDVDAPRLSRLVTIHFASSDANFSKKVVDAWGTSFIQATLERKFDTTAYARKFLEERLTQLREKIDESERQLVDYAAREGIVNLPTEDGRTPQEGGPRGERSLVVDDLAALNRELAQATADRIAAQSRVGSEGGATTEALANQGISEMRATRAELAGQYAKMMQQFEPGYPPAQALRTQLQQLDKSIAAEEARVRRTLNVTYRSSKSREAALQSRVNSLKSSVLDLRRRSIQYNIYQREVDTSRQLYDALLQRYKEIGIAGGVGVNNIAVVDAAETPDKPSSPKLVVNMMLALLAGLAMGALAAFVLEQLDDAISDPAEVANQLGVPLLGTIPTVAGGDPIGVLNDPKEEISEAYFSLQTNLAFATDHGFPRTLAVTSSRPAEGKSLTAYALAKILANAERRVVLIDSDMRSPSVHHNLRLKGEAGLSNILAGADDVASFVQRTTFEGLSIIAAGPTPPNAAELLSSERFGWLLRQLREQFDYVVVDSPPVMGLADALLVGRRAEMTVFVAEAHSTGKGVARVALQRLVEAGVNVLGVILTKFDSKRVHYGYGYDYGYGYGYGGQSKAREVV